MCVSFFSTFWLVNQLVQVPTFCRGPEESDSVVVLCCDFTLKNSEDIIFALDFIKIVQDLPTACNNQVTHVCFVVLYPDLTYINL